MKNNYLGSCLCGGVQFEISGSLEGFFLCHCKYCQKDTGSAHAANLFSNNAKLTWSLGAEKVKNFTLSGTRHGRGFCQDCGSAVPSLQMEGKLLVVPAGSLDCDVDFKPTAHIFYSSRASWDSELDRLEKFEKFPS